MSEKCVIKIADINGNKKDLLVEDKNNLNLDNLLKQDEIEKISSIELPDNITDLSDYSFYNMICLRGMVFPKSINSISKNAFLNSWPEAILTQKGSVIEKFFKNKEYVNNCNDSRPDVKIFYDRKEYDDFVS